MPDIAPVNAFAVDLAILLLVLRQMAKYITPEMRRNAREHLHRWFGETDDKQLYLPEAYR